MAYVLVLDVRLWAPKKSSNHVVYYPGNYILKSAVLCYQKIVNLNNKKRACVDLNRFQTNRCSDGMVHKQNKV